MAFEYQNFASLSVNLNRQKYGPLDISNVFTSQAHLNYYLSKGANKEGVSQYWLDVVPYPYAGQIVSLVVRQVHILRQLAGEDIIRRCIYAQCQEHQLLIYLVVVIVNDKINFT